MSNQFKYVFEFNKRQVDGRGDWKELLGGKGAGLAAMSRAGLPVPPGFTVSTEVCKIFLEQPHVYSETIQPEVRVALRKLEAVAGKSFGACSNPLLLSVRSGARFSMPGMMDTVLNIGLNSQTVVSLADETGNPRFAYDCYRRLIQMFGDVVLGVESRSFDRLLTQKTSQRGVGHEIELSVEDLQELCDQFLGIIENEGQEFPQEPERQLEMAIEAVFKSWNTPRAVTYRKINEIAADLGTAVNVQMMVFGNRGENSGSGVGFTRNPSTGERVLYGEYLANAQGEEVVAGTRTPLPFSRMETDFPEIYRQLLEIADLLERRYREMQDFEFTIEDGRLFMLQTRDGKRTGLAALRIALEMTEEGLISSDEAVLRVEPQQLEQLLHPVFEDDEAIVLAKGLPASPGAAVGKIVFSADDAVHWTDRGEKVILVRTETTPDDIHGMQVAEGILTSRGGMTSHAAVVARGMGKCSVVGCDALHILEEQSAVRVASHILYEGDVLSIDGATGRVMLGAVDRLEGGTGGEVLEKFMELTGDIASLAVRANADTPEDARNARRFGAVGIGLCRTEHMFFGVERLPAIQDLVVAEDSARRKEALSRLKGFQKQDFLQILEVMDGFPVTVRLLDPPLHEFLPRRQDLLEQVERLKTNQADVARIRQTQKLLERVEDLHEQNPMLGHRGCRLGITYPEITEMQVEALFEAACELVKNGRHPIVEVMIPLVSLRGEFHHQATLTRQIIEQVCRRSGVEVPHLVGTMIELPRAALVADQLAQESEFFSFGTNDLTQTAFGFSRDDSTPFIKAYLENGILQRDPFQTIDEEGVGQLLSIACAKGRHSRPEIKLGICGEHGGDPASVAFCHHLGLHYVSCSPFRVPVARLAAAQAAAQEHASDAGT